MLVAVIDHLMLALVSGHNCEAKFNKHCIVQGPRFIHSSELSYFAQSFVGGKLAILYTDEFLLLQCDDKRLALTNSSMQLSSLDIVWIVNNSQQSIIHESHFPTVNTLLSPGLVILYTIPSTLLYKFNWISVSKKNPLLKLHNYIWTIHITNKQNNE